MAGSWRSEARHRLRTLRALGLVATLAVEAAAASAPLAPGSTVRRLGADAGYTTVGGVTKPIVALTGKVEIELGDVPAGRLHLAAGVSPRYRGTGRIRCEASLAGDERRTVAVLQVDQDGSRWTSTDVDLAASPAQRLVMDCGAGGESPVSWAQPLLVPGTRPGPSPLVVVISLDTLRADHVSGFGAGAEATPALDRIGREGIRFIHTTAEGTWTIPSHFALFYGRVYGFPPRSPNVEGLARLLADRGYVTAAFTGGGYMGAFFRFHLGFDHFAEYDAAAHGGSDLGALPGVLDDARNWIERFDAPLLLFIHTYAVHERTHAEVRWSAEHDLKALDFVPEAGLLAETRGLYRELVHRTDAILEPFFARLRVLAAERPLLLVVLSDHGEAFGEHRNFRHGDDSPIVTLHDEVVRVPLLVWGPLVTQGEVNARPTMLGDVAPSILAAVGLQAPASMSGKNLWPLWVRETDAIASPTPKNAEPSISRGARGWALRSSSYKLIFEEAPEGPPHIELYAVGRDATESRNLAARHPRVLAALMRRLSRRITSLTGAPSRPGTLGACPLCRYDDMAAFWDRLGPAMLPAEPEVGAATRERLRALGYTDR